MSNFEVIKLEMLVAKTIITSFNFIIGQGRGGRSKIPVFGVTYILDDPSLGFKIQGGGHFSTFKNFSITMTLFRPPIYQLS